MKIPSAIWLALMSMILPTMGEDFFSIQHLEYHRKQPHKGPAVFETVQMEVKDKSPIKATVFVPCLEARISVQEQTKANAVFAKAYFYDNSGKLLEVAAKPAVVEREDGDKYDLPAYLPKGKSESIFFAVPEKIRSLQDWQAIVVFGDQYDAVAKAYPAATFEGLLDYPEKRIVNDKSNKRVERKPAIDPVIEHVVETGNLKQPQITLFLRVPIGMTDLSQAKGVLAMCLLARNVGDIKRMLEDVDPAREVKGLLTFAEKHQLVILCWGSRNLWDTTKNWDEQERLAYEQTDANFKDLSKAWAKGVEELSRKYGIPDRNFLLWGMSGSAQYAYRLALRKPEYFLAIHVHVPSSFDKPTPEASHMLWCLTTGEAESGYERSKKFYAQCRELGYPILYKAIPGLGHADHPAAASLGLKFYEYALTVRDQHDAYEKSKANLTPLPAVSTEKTVVEPWLESFRTPLFVGDIVNQEVFPFAKREMVPANFRTPLPTKEIADTWNK